MGGSKHAVNVIPALNFQIASQSWQCLMQTAVNETAHTFAGSQPPASAAFFPFAANVQIPSGMPTRQRADWLADV